MSKEEIKELVEGVSATAGTAIIVSAFIPVMSMDSLLSSYQDEVDIISKIDDLIAVAPNQDEEKDPIYRVLIRTKAVHEGTKEALEKAIASGANPN
jgi:hypothetical protein